VGLKNPEPSALCQIRRLNYTSPYKKTHYPAKTVDTAPQFTLNLTKKSGSALKNDEAKNEKNIRDLVFNNTFLQFVRS
jgi:hypothetical protein